MLTGDASKLAQRIAEQKERILAEGHVLLDAMCEATPDARFDEILARASEIAEEKARVIIANELGKVLMKDRNCGGRMNMNDNTRRVVFDAKAWQEGFAAGRRGLQWNANPYPAGSDASVGWFSGLLEGQAKPLSVEQ
jgi:hypothetical protein